MEILTSLGINSTIGIQFLVFIVVYTCLSQILFKPYFKAFLARKEKTTGQTEIAERLVAEAKELQTKYESKAQQINAQYKAAYDISRSEALREYDRLITDARNEAKSILESAKEKINRDIVAAEKELSRETPEVAKVIAARLLGKDLAL